MLVAYFDKSSDDPTGITSVAGYVARCEDWAAIEDEWRAAVAYWSTRKEFASLGMFHMAALEYAIGREDADLCTKYFSDIITRSSLHAIGSALYNAHWDFSDWTPDTTVRLGTRYEQCLDFAFGTLHNFMVEEYPSRTVSVVCCLDAPFPNIQRIFSARKSTDCPEFREIAHGAAKQYIALQCCDLGAGLLRKSWRELWRSKEWQVPWGDLPVGKGKRKMTSFWSLAQGEILRRSLSSLEQKRTEETR